MTRSGGCRRVAVEFSHSSCTIKSAFKAVNHFIFGKIVLNNTLEIKTEGWPSLQSILKQTEDGFEHHKRLDTSAPKNLLYPIALSASELLESGEEANVKRCDNPECILYFYDTTKNGSRRWCSMDQCGNRMKAKRYYDRQKEDD